MGDIRRLLVLAAVAVTACASLSACYMGPDPVQYGALAVVDGPEGSAAPTVSFTTDDLARIGNGQVLASMDDRKSAVVSRESFVTQACAKKGPGAR